MWKTVLILLCVLVSVAIAQTITRTPAGTLGIGEVKSWQVDAVRNEGDKFVHWHFQPTERRFQFSEHEWVEGIAESWFNSNLGTRLLKERICNICLRWEILIWKSYASSTDEPMVLDLDELVGRIEKKKGKEWK